MKPLSEEQARQALLTGIEFCQRHQLSPNRSGNLSLRCDSGWLITPSGVADDNVGIDDLVLMPEAHSKCGRKPSSEAPMHAAVYERYPDIQAVVHCHSAWATALACLRRPIPAFHYMVAVAGGNDIRCADYALFGSEQLSKNAMQALQGRKACLLANHGQLSTGQTLEHALELALEVETLAEQYMKALTIGDPVLLSNAEMVDVHKSFKTYGQNAEQS